MRRVIVDHGVWGKCVERLVRFCTVEQAYQGKMGGAPHLFVKLTESGAGDALLVLTKEISRTAEGCSNSNFTAEDHCGPYRSAEPLPTPTLR